MWKDNLVIQHLSDEMEFAIAYSIPGDSFAQELWISKVPGATGLLLPKTYNTRWISQVESKVQ